MRIRFVGHAAILIEANNLRILSDPWWQGPCFGSQWWIFPRPDLAEVEAGPIDYIYISHGHADHFHRGTLRRFPSGTKVLVSSDLDIGPHIREMGFEVIEVRPDEERDLGNGVSARIMPTDGGDTLMAVNDGRETCLNLNDALHASPEDVINDVTVRLRQLYPKIDYVFCGYGSASHFPNCFVIPGKDNALSAAKRQQYFNRRWCDIVRRLTPTYAFPFAADVVFLDSELLWANEPVHNAERPTDVFTAQNPDNQTQAIDIAPGFSIVDGKVQDDVRFAPIKNDDILSVYRDERARKANTADSSGRDLEVIVERLKENVRICERYLQEFSGSYKFLIALQGLEDGIEIVKSGRDIAVRRVALSSLQRQDYDLVATTYYAYLRRAFTMEYGHETLFVGSGIIFDYRDAARVPENLHREMASLLRSVSAPPRSRFGDQPRWLFELKQTVKKLLGRRVEDLYDLKAWTVYET